MQLMMFSIENSLEYGRGLCKNRNGLFSLTNSNALASFDRTRREYPELDDRGVIRVLCSRLLREADLEPPIDTSVLASMCGIARIEHLDQPWAGLLIPREDGHVVALRAGDGHRRQRFTIMHEAAHTLLPGLSEAPEYRCEPQKQRPPKERLADLGAAELLMPRQYFEGDLGWFGLRMGGVSALADRYRTSLEATALRAVELSCRPVLCVVLKSVEEDDSVRDVRLEAVYASRKGRWPFIPRGTSVSTRSVFARAVSERLIEGEANLAEIVPGADAPVSISAMSCPRVARDRVEQRVIALITPRVAKGVSHV